MIHLSRACRRPVTVPRESASRIRGMRMTVQISAYDEGQKAMMRTIAIDEVIKAVQPLTVKVDQLAKGLQDLKESVIELQSSQKESVTELKSSLKEMNMNMQLYFVILLAFIAAGGKDIVPALLKFVGK